MGLVLPSLHLRDNLQLKPGQYCLLIKGNEVASAEILTDHYLALDSGGVMREIDGIDTVEPAFNIPAKWVPETDKLNAEIAGYTLIDPTSVIVTHLSEIIKQHAYELLSRQDVRTMLDKLRLTNETIVNEVLWPEQEEEEQYADRTVSFMRLSALWPLALL